MKILIIEDDLSFQEILRKALEQERYIVEVAPNYRTGLIKLSDYTYDCILLDINLPDGNGLSLLRELKAMKKASEITEDDLKDGEKEIQKITDSFIKEIDDLSAAKQKEIMEI